MFRSGISRRAASPPGMEHDTASIGYGRSRQTLLQAPLMRTGGTTTVGLRAQASLNRAFFAGFGG